MYFQHRYITLTAVITAYIMDVIYVFYMKNRSQYG